MSIANLLSRFVGSGVRSRGLEYFKGGQVELEAAENTFVTAAVWGSHEYDVTLKLEGSEVTATCTCPYAEDTGHCKHIWATVLAVEGKPFARNVVAANPIAFYCEGSYDDADDDDFGEDDEYSKPSPRRKPSTAPVKAKPVAPPPPPPPPMWMEALSEIRTKTKPVFAYRLIARDTVEEKVLALQESKRGLAEAILGGEGSLISELKREDLELLLS